MATYAHPQADGSWRVFVEDGGDSYRSPISGPLTSDEAEKWVREWTPTFLLELVIVTPGVHRRPLRRLTPLAHHPHRNGLAHTRGRSHGPLRSPLIHWR